MMSCTLVAAIRALALLLLAAVAVALMVGDASAHELSDRAWPAPDSVLDASPEVVEIAFPGSLADKGNRLVVQSQRGETIIDVDPAVLRDAASSSLSVDLGTTLANGTYTVSWTAVHEGGVRENGSYAFTVAAGRRVSTASNDVWLAWAGTAIGLGVIVIGSWWLLRRNGTRHLPAARK